VLNKKLAGVHFPRGKVGSGFQYGGFMLLRFATVFGYALLCLVGCSAALSTNANDYVGEYLLQPAHSVPEGFPYLVVLRKDHIAVNVSYSRDSGRVLIVQKKWYLEHGTDEEMVIGDPSASRVYPIDQSDSTIKLIINERGQYYEKVRLIPR
jgi:hypothetical protein